MSTRANIIIKDSDSEKNLITSDKIEFHPDLGAHKTYRGYKWQPSPGDWEVSYVKPGCRKFRVFIGTLAQFKKAVDKVYILNFPMPGSRGLV